MTCFLRATRKGLGKQLSHIMGRKHDSLLQRGHMKMYSIVNINIYVNWLLFLFFFSFFQDKQDRNHFIKGDFVFHTEHVVELVAKLLVQVDSRNDILAPVHVADKYACSKFYIMS